MSEAELNAGAKFNPATDVPQGDMKAIAKGPGDIWPLENAKAKKFDGGKARFELIPPFALEAAAQVFTFGADKYGDRNWEQGLDYSRLKGALDRHMNAIWKGIDLDDESGLPHVGHALCCLLMLGEEMLNPVYQKGQKLDDRPNNSINVGRFDV